MTNLKYLMVLTVFGNLQVKQSPPEHEMLCWRDNINNVGFAFVLDTPN